MILVNFCYIFNRYIHDYDVYLLFNKIKYKFYSNFFITYINLLIEKSINRFYSIITGFN